MDQTAIPFFAEISPELPPELLSQVLEKSSMVTFKPGDLIIESGEVSNKGYLIVKGLIRNYHIMPDDSEHSVLFRKEGEFVVSYPSMFNGEPSTENTEALEETTAIELNLHEIRELIKNNLEFAGAYIKILEQSLVMTISRIDDFTLRTPEERYVRFISKHPDLTDRIQQQHLASFLGITPISLSRIKARLRRKAS
jgi:CRP-like cAMP-binding protein